MNSNSFKIFGAGVLLVVAGILVYRVATDPGPLGTNQINFICVATGDTFHIHRNEIATVPVENPRTHEATLVPCYEKEDGALYVSEHFRGAVEQLGEKNHYVDMSTLRVREP